MNLDLTPEQTAYRQAVIDFARHNLSRAGQPVDEASFDHEGWKRCAEFGLAGVHVPEEYGGQGADPVTVAVALEALGYTCEDNGLLFSLGAHLWSAVTPILRFGTDAQRERFLPGLCDGSLIGVQGMTESESGSDAFSLQTRLIDHGDMLELRGAKTYVTNAPVADLFVIFATSDPALGWAGLNAVLVERDTPGLHVGPPMHKLGLRSSPMGELVMDGCRVPVENRLGPAGGGMAVFNHSMEWERGFILATALGSMQRQLEQSIRYARERRQFGGPIAQFQAVSHRVVDMHARLEAARLLLYRLACRRNANTATDADAALVKLMVSEAWVTSSLDALKLHGAAGYTGAFGIERDLRDALGSRIYSGTSDIQRNLIGRSLGL